MEILTGCPNCGSNTIRFLHESIDFTVSKEKFTIQECSNCGLVFTNPRPLPASIGKYYESDDYISHSNSTKGLINKLYHLVRKFSIQKKISIVESLPVRGRSLLDVGCGTGLFLEGIRQKEWNVTGIEPSSKTRDRIIADYGFPVYPDFESLKGKNTFDIITMWHVLEHVHDIAKSLSSIRELLTDDGHSIIAVPNLTSWDAVHYGKAWAAYDVPRHLFHFKPEVIKEIFSSNGFDFVRSLPMKMDSFYVSMLSEKYKSSFLGTIKAFFVGLISNINAKGDAEKYSSVIYIFKKRLERG